MVTDQEVESDPAITSGSVYPAAGFVQVANQQSIRTHLHRS